MLCLTAVTLSGISGNGCLAQSFVTGRRNLYLPDVALAQSVCTVLAQLSQALKTCTTNLPQPETLDFFISICFDFSSTESGGSTADLGWRTTQPAPSKAQLLDATSLSQAALMSAASDAQLLLLGMRYQLS